MEKYLYFATLISLLIILFVTPVWFAEAVEILNRTRSKVRFIPVVNEIRAEVIYRGFGPITLSWILLVVSSAGKMISWWYAYGSIVYMVFHYMLLVSLAFWYLAKCLDIIHITRMLGITSGLAGVAMCIVYPIGYYMLLNTCKLYRTLNSDGSTQS